jgi:selenocysteine lyase/cysteine desulfurase
VTASAASNVTSKITDLKGLNEIVSKLSVNLEKLKVHIPLLIFSVDCAAFCSHHELNLAVYDQIDFAHMSPHKNLGGAESCGILIAKKSIVKNAKPTFPGGGTVAFVKGYSK